LQSLGKPHVGSFNFMLDEGPKLAVQDIDPVEFIFEPTGDRIKLWLVDARLEAPSVPSGTYGVKVSILFIFRFGFTVKILLSKFEQFSSQIHQIYVLYRSLLDNYSYWWYILANSYLSLIFSQNYDRS
jgi:hypothetical protein